MNRVLLSISYKGTSYCGWQKQNKGISIQGIIENAIFEGIGEHIHLYASGRTDAGVHAICQTAHFDTNFNQIDKLPYILNFRLPPDIRILKAQKVFDNFNARFDVKQKKYIYKLCLNEIESPFYNDLMAYCNYTLDIELMKRAAKLLIGEHNFKGFSSTNSNIKDFVRIIYEININKTSDIITLSFVGNGFLYNMVRIIVGTLIDIGRGKLDISVIAEILEKQDRRLAGKTAPAKGLYLAEVKY